MNTSISACDDFYEYSNGGWLRRTEIPPAFSSWNSRSVLIESNRDALRAILESAARDLKAGKGSNPRLIGDYYAACMDEAAIEATGTKPLKPFLSRLIR